MPTIRLAIEDDASQIRRIYAPFCMDNSPVSFEVEPPDVDEMRRRIATTLVWHPWLICDDGGEVQGYVYGSSHNPREAYRWSANVSAYIEESRRGSGIGRALYTSLFALLRLQGYINALAGTTLPNPASVGLHRAMGFEPVGVYREVGFKGGSWHDTAWWQLSLVEKPDRPRPPLTLSEARTLPGWGPAIAAGVPLLRT